MGTVERKRTGGCAKARLLGHGRKDVALGREGPTGAAQVLKSMNHPFIVNLRYVGVRLALQQRCSSCAPMRQCALIK